jgi:hypothetical protein
MTDYRFDLPADFEEYAWEVEIKGWFEGAVLTFQGKKYRLLFYDPVRVGQEIQSSIEREGAFFDPNLVVVPSVTRSNMQRAAARLAERQVAIMKRGYTIDLVEEIVTPELWRTP